MTAAPGRLQAVPAGSPAPAPPPHLSPRAVDYWVTLTGAYALGLHELELLRRLCEAIDLADEARQLVATEGLTVTDRYGQVKAHPAVNIERDARIAIARLTRELDFAPEPPDVRPPRRRR